MIRSKILVLTAITILFLSTLPMSSGQVIDKKNYSVESIDEWEIIKTDVLFIAVPSNKTVPMFILRYNNDNSILYIVKYEGLSEAWLFASETFTHDKLFKDTKGFTNEFMVRANSHGWIDYPGAVLKINQIARNLHSFYFPFSQGKWELTPIKEINAKDGTLVGLAFAFILSDTIDPSFGFVNGNIMIRNKLFFNPVEMQIENNKLVLSRAELKTDIIISKWKWNYDIFYNAIKELSYPLPEMEPKLTLSITFNVRSVDGRNLVDIFNEERDDILEASNQDNPKVEVKVGDNTFTIGKVEKEDYITKTSDLPKLEILTKERNIASFFRFNPNANVIFDDQRNMGSIDVEGVFWAKRSLKVFLIYPYFGGGTLLHDPSIGISSPELEGETVKYIFKPPITSEYIVPPPQSIVPIEIVPFFELVTGAIVFLMIVALVIVVTNKMRMEVLNGF
ncbi:MAG: hypothetical protein QW698_06865 [Nitrososphaerales archaeon]